MYNGRVLSRSYALERREKEKKISDLIKKKNKKPLCSRRKIAKDAKNIFILKNEKLIYKKPYYKNKGAKNIDKDCIKNT